MFKCRISTCIDQYSSDLKPYDTEKFKHNNIIELNSAHELGELIHEACDINFEDYLERCDWINVELHVDVENDMFVLNIFRDYNY